MTKEEAAYILRLCQEHELPRPKRSWKNEGYELYWKTDRIEVMLSDYDAAYHFCRTMFSEKKNQWRL